MSGYGAFCYECGGRGFIVNCIDDLCHSGDEGCIHGDGNLVCLACDGEGSIQEWDNDFEDDEA